MDTNSFWLADISNEHAAISLVIKDQKFHVKSAGPSVSYDSLESFVAAVDTSLSSAAESAGISPETEPDKVALIIPPFWVGADGRIISERLKYFNTVLKELKLKPMGFISFDEAIVEDANSRDGFPASFVLLHLTSNSFTASLVYLGKVIERLHKQFSGEFNPGMLESALLEFQAESTLPPEIIITGNPGQDIVEKIKSYPWIGKKNVETFLHFPDIKTYSADELNRIFVRVISSQFDTSAAPATSNDDDEEVSPIDPQPDITPEHTPKIVKEPIETAELDEVSPSDLGFVTADNFVVPEVEPDLMTHPQPDPVPDGQEEQALPPPTKTAKKFSLPHLRLPSLHLRFKSVLLAPLALLPLLLLIPFYFTKAKVTLYMTPYNLTQTLNVTFDSDAEEIDLSKNTIPINRQNYDITTSASIESTGEKTIGDKSQGEVSVFNKQDKVQSLPKGTELTDSSGKKYILVNSAQIDSSSSDLIKGVITLGQTKVMLQASDIGPEYNLPKDTILRFKEFPESLMVARVGEGLSGGTKKQIKAVSVSDKTSLETKLNETVSSSIEERLSRELNDRPTIVKELTYIKKGRIEFNREVGEEADELKGDITSTVYVYFFDSDQKQSIINKVFATQPGFADMRIDPENFKFEVVVTKASVDRPSAKVTISGNGYQKMDSNHLAKLFSGKSHKSVSEIIKKELPRVYNYQIESNFDFINSINPLPFRKENITFELK